MLHPRPGLMASFALACTLALTSTAEPALGGGPGDRLQLVLSGNSVAGGPGGGIATEFGRAGYNDDVPTECIIILCFPGRSEPQEIGLKGSWSISARYRLHRELSLLAGFSNSELGGGEGYRIHPAGSQPPDDLIASSWGGELFWLGALWTPRPWLHLGGGPGLYHLSGGVGGGNNHDARRPGLTAEAGLRTPSRWAIFLDLTTRYHWILSEDVSYQAEQATIALRPEWSHLEIALGIGLGRSSP